MKTDHDHDYTISNGEVFPKDPQAGIFETTETRFCLVLGCGEQEVFTEGELDD